MSTNHRAGKKIGGRHTTVIDAAKTIINFLNKNPYVSNIAIGYIKTGLKPALQRMKIKSENGCLLLKIRGTISIQEIRVFSRDLDMMQKILEEKFRAVK